VLLLLLRLLTTLVPRRFEMAHAIAALDGVRNGDRSSTRCCRTAGFNAAMIEDVAWCDEDATAIRRTES
jgi:hypothetical protein